MSERFKSIAMLGVTAASLYYVSTGAFSRKSRNEILDRDGHQCTICGATDHLEAAHYNHNRTYPQYDDPSNGRTLCIYHHLEDHEGAPRNGLNLAGNQKAVKLIYSRLPDEEPPEWFKQKVIYQAVDNK